MAVTSASNTALAAALKPSNGLTSLEQQTLKGLDGDDLLRAEAQLKLSKRQETVSFISNIMKKMNEIIMATVNNLR